MRYLCWTSSWIGPFSRIDLTGSGGTWFHQESTTCSDRDGYDPHRYHGNGWQLHGGCTLDPNFMELLGFKTVRWGEVMVALTPEVVAYWTCEDPGAPSHTSVWQRDMRSMVKCNNFTLQEAHQKSSKYYLKCHETVSWSVSLLPCKSDFSFLCSIFFVFFFCLSFVH